MRPHREFVPEKGRDKMLSLAIFNQSSAVQDNASYYSASTSDRGSRSSNAYNFMQRRRHEAGDPTTQRQQALIRMANYANSEIPLCVSSVLSPVSRPSDAQVTIPLSSLQLVPSLTTWLENSRLEIWNRKGYSDWIFRTLKLLLCEQYALATS